MGDYNHEIGCMLNIFIVSALLGTWKLIEIIIWVFNHIHISIN